MVTLEGRQSLCVTDEWVEAQSGQATSWELREGSGGVCLLTVPPETSTGPGAWEALTVFVGEWGAPTWCS